MFHRDGDDKDQRTAFTRRGVLIGLAQAAGFGVLAARLHQLQIVDGARYGLLADDNRVSEQPLAPMRGQILDRAGELLAGNDLEYQVTIEAVRARDPRVVLDRIGRILPLEAEDHDAIVNRIRRQSPKVPVVVWTNPTWQQIAAINLHAPSLPGIEVQRAPRRRYFHGHSVGHIVGHVGSIEKAALGDDPVLRVPGMRIGRTGVERALDDTLRGERGHVRQEVTARGDSVRIIEQRDPEPGQDIALTIEAGLQSRLLKRLSQEKRAAAVAMDVITGEVIAMCSVPTFDPEDLVNGARRGMRTPAHVLPGLAQPQHNAQVNRTIRGLYPPGSTFKMVTALAALEAGVITAAEKLPCTGKLEYAGHAFGCWRRSGHGPCDLHRAMRESCDCYFYEVARRTGIDGIAAMARRFGFGQTFDCGIAHQKPGVVPTPEWKRARLGRSWLGGETLLAGIGQGYVLSTPLQLAVMTARIATGKAVSPTLIRNAADRQQPHPALDVRPDWLRLIQGAMVAVVHEDGGTGSRAKLDGGQMLVAGKTGTSQVAGIRNDKQKSELAWHHRDHALFVCYAPVAAPRYAVSVIVEHGGGGGSVAAPIARDILQAIFERDPNAAGYPAVEIGAAVSGSGNRRS